MSDRFNRVAVAVYVSVSVWKKELKDRNVKRKQKIKMQQARDLRDDDVMRLTCSPAVASQFEGPATCGHACFRFHTGASGILNILDRVYVPEVDLC